MSTFCVDSAKILGSTFKSFNRSNIQAKVHEIHEIEHAADSAHHTILNKLAKEFLPPIEREDIIDITQRIDDVTDAVEDVLICIDIYNIRNIKPEAIKFADLIVECCNLLNEVLVEFKHFKNSKTLQDKIIELNRLEGEGDKLYADSVRKLYSNPTDPVELISWTTIFHRLEHCCDACETVANTVESVVINNS